VNALNIVKATRHFGLGGLRTTLKSKNPPSLKKTVNHLVASAQFRVEGVFLLKELRVIYLKNCEAYQFSLSRGLSILSNAFLLTWVYSMVVRMLLCPSR